MGQQYYQSLPRTRRWQELVGLLEAGAGAAQVANATIKAAEGGLERPGKDRGLVDTIWILTQLPQAARADDFAGALRNLGLGVSANPTLMEITGALTDALDQRLIETGGRTDLGEMAQMAAAETLQHVVGGRSQRLIGGVSDVQIELGRLATAHQFGIFARSFFGRLATRYLDYFLGASGSRVGS